MKLIPFSRYKIVGHSMEPTLKSGQVVWVNNWAYLFNQLEINDIVLFKREGKDMVKKVNQIEKDKVFLIGDNQADSLDSRTFGEVSQKEIIGKVLV